MKWIVLLWPRRPEPTDGGAAGSGDSPPQAPLAPVADSALTDAGVLAKWLVPTAAAMFAVLGYVIESAHSSLLGGGISSSAGAGFAAAAADFAYDLPTIAVDLLLACADQRCGRSGTALLAGHGLTLLVALIAVLVALWLSRKRHRATVVWRTMLVPVLLLSLLAGKFIWMDAPVARIENIVIGNPEDVPLGGPSRVRSGGPLSALVDERAALLFKHIVCSRGVQWPRAGPRVDCSGVEGTGHELATGEFAARLIACGLVAWLAWRVARENASRWRLTLCVLSLGTLLTLPYAYGKLLKPTLFELGRVDLATPLSDAVSIERDQRPLSAMLLARRANAVEFLVEGLGRCANEAKYLVTKVWSVSNSQLLAFREISRQDLIAWKFSHEQANVCGDAPPPGSSNLN